MNDISQVKLLQEWIPGATNHFKCKLLFRATRDGFKASMFHEKCESQQPLLVIAESSTGVRFGGITSINWSDSGYKNVKDAFLFSLTTKEKLALKDPSKAIFANKDCGPNFGHYPDLVLLDQKNSGDTNKAQVGTSYETLKNGRTSFTGTPEFKLDELEVYTVLKE